MKLKVLGSSSSGNCYLIENETECLIIEAGLSFMEVKIATNFNVLKIVGLLVSHEHKDHCGKLQEFEKAGINVFYPSRIQGKTGTEKRMKKKLGGFIITAFPLKHNVPCYGFLIEHQEIGNLLFATDTEYVKEVFRGKFELNHILIETNYSKELVERDSAKYEHQITGHMDIETTCRFLEANNNPSLLNVVLCHLSGDCGDAEQFMQKAKQAVGCNVEIAKKGVTVNLDIVPFI